MREYWNQFLHWKGWAACAAFFVGAYRWILGLPGLFVAALSAGCGAGLGWVFARGLEQWPPAWALFGLSAFALTAVCIRLPGVLRGLVRWIDSRPKLRAFLENKELKFTLGLYFEQIVNFSYGIFKTAAGVVVGSAWIGCDGIYNLAQALVQLFQILGRRRARTPEAQWRSYRMCGGMILLMHLTLIGLVFQMVNWNRAEDHGSIMIFATAGFAFYKLIASLTKVVRDRRHTHPIDSSVRMLGLSQAYFAMFSMQASLLHTFGSGARWENLLNLAVGCFVCLMVACVGIYMIRRGSREIKTLREK